MTLFDTPPPPSQSPLPPAPQPTPSTSAKARKLILGILGGVVLLFVLLTVFAIVALRVLGTTVDEALTVDAQPVQSAVVESAAVEGATPSGLAFGDTFVDEQGLFTMTPHAHWVPATPLPGTPAGTPTWTLENQAGTILAHITVVTGPTYGQIDSATYLAQILPNYEALPEVNVSSETLTRNGRDYIVVSVDYLEDNGQRNALRQVILLGQDTIVAGTLVSQAATIDEIASNELDALFTMDEISATD